MTKPLPPLAERMRRHRGEMNLALELGVTPAEAAAIIAAREARERWAMTAQRIRTATPRTRRVGDVTAQITARMVHWWERD